MGEQKNLVVINGKTYDAVSGELVQPSAKPAAPFSDFISAPSATKPATAKQSSQSKRVAHHLTHHKTQKSVTLKRPSQKPLKQSKTISKSSPVKSTNPTSRQGIIALPESDSRLARAKQISKSAAISRFSAKEPAVQKRHEPLAVQPAPGTSTHVNSSNSTLIADSNAADEDIFNKALSQAESHKQPPHKIGRQHRIAKKFGLSPKAANILAGALVVVVLAGFIAYQNAPYVAMKVAASRSGLASASLPSYRPSGFSLSRNVGASPGQVTLSFHSNSDDRNFTITQSSSNWDSQTLADSYLSNKQAQRIEEANGKTVYIYNSSDATWVDGGTWYRIEGNSSLTSDQLLKLANSF